MGEISFLSDFAPTTPTTSASTTHGGKQCSRTRRNASRLTGTGVDNLIRFHASFQFGQDKALNPWLRNPAIPAICLPGVWEAPGTPKNIDDLFSTIAPDGGFEVHGREEIPLFNKKRKYFLQVHRVHS